MAYTTIDDSSAHFQVAPTWTGGTSAKTLTNDGNSDLQPDLVWIKCRNASQPHSITDSSRGTSKSFTSATTAAEVDDSRFTSFNTDGFTLAGSSGPVNTSGGEYVGWQWKANGGTTTSATTTGGIDSATRQVDSTSKFSIIAYTCESTQAAGTIEHGLGVAPEFMLIKRRANTDNWAVYHHKNTAAPETDILSLNTTNATTDHAGPWNDTAPTSSVFTLGALSDTNEGSGETYICYAWAGVQGYSKFGSYEGNGDANGTFVYTGFKPAWLVVKGIDSTGAWYIVDNRRNPYNLTNLHIPTTNEGGETSAATGLHVDLLSNGFKLRDDWSDTNEDDETFIYAAFAEEPLVTSSGVPATAR
jgi:hypothetical protein